MSKLTADILVQLFDLYDAPASVEPSSAVVVDVIDLRSEAVARLRQLLVQTRHGVPLVVLLHRNDPRERLMAMTLGATRTLHPPFDPAQLRAVLPASEPFAETEPLSPSAVQVSRAARDFFADMFVPDRPVTPVLADTGTDLIGQAIRDTGIRDWVRAVRRFDDATHQHCLLVAGLAAAFARILGLSEFECHRLTKAALLHDVGKIHIPAAILNKPGKLDDDEIAVMRQHPGKGHAMLCDQGFHPEILRVVRSHHEMLDGSGYPDGLREADIPDLVRVVTVCDIYGALIERRPYKSPMPGEKAFAILEDMTGRLDAPIVAAFRPVVTTFVSHSQLDA